MLQDPDLLLFSTTPSGLPNTASKHPDRRVRTGCFVLHGAR